jgi:hypothetical protein
MDPHLQDQTTGGSMPEKQTLERAREDAREGKSPSTQAGEFVREEMDHIREGKHGARSTKQAIAIGLSKARRAGVKLPAPAGKASAEKAAPNAKPSTTRSRATLKALKREGSSAASPESLARQAHESATRRGPAKRKAAARKAARTRARNT